MKKFSIISFSIFTILSSCKKENKLANTPQILSQIPKSIQLSKSEYDLLSSYFKNNPLKADSFLRVLSTKKQIPSSNNHKLTSNFTNSDVSNFQDEEEDDVTNTAGDATLDGAYYGTEGYSLTEDPSLWGGDQLYVGTVNVSTILNKRSNVVNVIIPYLYSPYRGGAFIPSNFLTSSGYKSNQMNIIGPALGSITSGPFQFVNLSSQSNYDMNPVTGYSEGTAMETRTRSLTSNGQYKFTAAGQGIGAEVSAGITIVSQLASTTQYQYVLQFTIKNNFGFNRPTITYTFGAYSRGIQSN